MLYCTGVIIALLGRVQTNLAKSKNAFEHVSAESILIVALGQTIVLREAKMLRLKANLFREKALLPKVNLLLAKALLQKAALLDWCAPGLSVAILGRSKATLQKCARKSHLKC